MMDRWFVVLALALAAAPGAAAVPTFTRLVGTGDPVPGAEGETFLEVRKAQLAGQWVLASAYSATRSGLYAFHGNQSWEVVSRYSAVPGIPAGAELQLDAPATYDIDSSGLVVFSTPWYVTADPDINGVGVWVWQAGHTDVVVVSGEIVAGSDEPYWGTRHPVVEGGVVHLAAFEGLPGDASKALYRWSRGTGVSRVMGSGFQEITRPRVADGRVAFLGRDELGVAGFWSVSPDGSDVRLEHDFASPYPGGPPASSWELITGPTLPIATATPITFGAQSSGDPERRGIYRLWGGGTFELLYDGADPDPTLPGAHHRIVPGLAGSGENVAFMLHDPTQVSTLGRRLIVRDGAGEYHLIAAEGRDFEGAPVGLIEFMHGAMDGDRLAFNVLRPGDGAVWIADFGAGAPSVLEVPTLETWALAALALGLLVAASRVLRRRVL